MLCSALIRSFLLIRLPVRPSARPRAALTRTQLCSAACARVPARATRCTRACERREGGELESRGGAGTGRALHEEDVDGVEREHLDRLEPRRLAVDHHLRATQRVIQFYTQLRPLSTVYCNCTVQSERVSHERRSLCVVYSAVQFTRVQMSELE